MDNLIHSQAKQINLLNATLEAEQAISDSLTSVLVLSKAANNDLLNANEFNQDQIEALKKSLKMMKRQRTFYKTTSIVAPMIAFATGFILAK